MQSLLRAVAPRPGPAGSDCLDDITIAAIVNGTPEPATRATACQHLASCARCRRAVAAVSRLIGDAAVAGEVVALERRPWSRRWGLPVGLAAAAAVVLLLSWPQKVDDGAPPHRAPTVTAGSQPVPLFPIGTVAAAASLRWTAVAGADRYRVTLFDAEGRVLYETQVTDTAAALPDSVTLVAARAYLWKVEARTGWDRWAPSQLVSFSVARDSPP